MSPLSGVLRLRLSKGQPLVKGLSPRKAKKILRDKEVRGKKLTKKQKAFFGARAAGLPIKRK